jgi:hypothetical protein
MPVAGWPASERVNSPVMGFGKTAPVLKHIEHFCAGAVEPGVDGRQAHGDQQQKAERQTWPVFRRGPWKSAPSSLAPGFRPGL